MIIWVKAPRRSRRTASATTPCASGLFQKSSAARTNPPAKPSAEAKAVSGRIQARGTSTADSRATPAAPSIANSGESANQSTDGVSIMGRATRGS
jgi:hypothetical protein